LPLTYGAVEVTVAKPGQAPFALWTHLRIKPERFDISGGWVNDRRSSITNEAFLKTLKRLHVNTGHLANTSGYTDTELYTRYPLKYFNQLTPFDTYDTEAVLPRIHAVEFLGEPQYGGGRPVPPQEVWQKLRPYAATRLATSVTHSEERIWRDYAGLSDYPHYDAYRVTAPSPDAWSKYDRWEGRTIRWGAPLETIGDMSRSLRELNRPRPCAYWSQGPHAGWEVYGGRKRTSPTPDEIRLQAYHAVSTRITSLYWFNLSLKSLVHWRDTLDELGRVGRELRLLDEFLLEGDAYRHTRLKRPDGKLDWDIASVCGPRAGLLFALDLGYTADPADRVFRFGAPRDARWVFPLPSYLQNVVTVMRLDADGVHDARWTKQGNSIEITDRASRVVIYVATPDQGLRDRLESKRKELLKEEASWQFDPAHNDRDFEQLKRLAETR
jgi:YD repeat-containing protein